MQHFKKIFISGIIWKFIFYLSSFCLNLLFANRLGATASGPFFFLFNNLLILLLFLNFGFESAITYAHSKKEFSFNYLLSAGLAWSFLASILFTIVFYILSAFHFVETTPLIIFIILYIFSLLINSFVSGLFYSSNNHIIPNLITSIGNIVLIFYLLFYSSDKIAEMANAFMKAYLFMGICTGFALLIYTSRNIRLFYLKGIFNKKLLNYSLHFFLTNAFVTLLLRIDLWLIKHLCTDYDLGNYIQTTKFTQLILLLPNLASFALFPLVTQNIGKANIENKLTRLVNFYFYFSLTSCILLAVTGYWLFPFLYGPSFSKMYLIFIILIPGLLCLVASYPIAAFFSGINRNQVITFAAAGSLIIMILFDLLLIPRFSIYGAAWGSSAAYSFYFFWLLIKFKKYHIAEIKEIFRIRDFYISLNLLIQQRA